MGSMWIRGFGETGVTDVAQLVAIHLRSNCYPPVPSIMNPVAVEAINKAVEAESIEDGTLYEERLQLPEGIMFRGDESGTASVSDIIESLRLESIVDMVLQNHDEEMNDEGSDGNEG